MKTRLPDALLSDPATNMFPPDPPADRKFLLPRANSEVPDDIVFYWPYARECFPSTWFNNPPENEQSDLARA